MNKLHFAIDIHGSKQKVWEALFNDAPYREWTHVFNTNGSYFEGNWEEDSKMLFLGPDDDGNLGGLVSRIAANHPYDFMSIEHLGEIMNGVEDTTSDHIKSWVGAHENYTLTEDKGVTTLAIDLDVDHSNEDMFQQAWPLALAKLKEIVEAN